MRKARLRWFGRIRRRTSDAQVRRCETIECSIIKGVKVCRRRIGVKLFRQDLKILGLVEDRAQDRKLWRARIKAVSYTHLTLPTNREV